MSTGGAASSSLSARSWELTSYGVDWLSCSAPFGDRGDPLWQAGSALIAAEIAAGNTERKWRNFGLSGFQSGQTVVASNAESVFVQLSGEQAREHWRGLLPLAVNVSRLDLQVTAEYLDGASSVAEAVYHQVSRRKASGGRPLGAQLVQGTDGGSTCYLGSRSSDRFGRVYDKGVQAGLQAPGRLWRWEVELKRAVALQAAGKAASSPDPDAFAAGAVWGQFSAWDARPPWIATGGSIPQPQPRISDDQRRLEWLHRSIRPLVLELIRRRGFAEVLGALGIPPTDSAVAVPPSFPSTTDRRFQA